MLSKIWRNFPGLCLVSYHFQLLGLDFWKICFDLESNFKSRPGLFNTSCALSLLCDFENQGHLDDGAVESPKNVNNQVSSSTISSLSHTTLSDQFARSIVLILPGWPLALFQNMSGCPSLHPHLAGTEHSRRIGHRGDYPLRNFGTSVP